MKRLPGILALFFASFSIAQSSSSDAPVAREFSDFGFLGHLRTELLLNEKLRTNLEFGINTQENYILFNEVYEYYAQIGIDANPGGRWRLGSSGRFNRNFYQYSSFLGKGYFAHAGKLGSLYFYKELSGELFTYGKIAQYKPPTQARLGLGVALGKHWDSKKLPFYIETALKVYSNKYFDSTFQFIYQQRLIDQTRLTIEGGVRPVEWFWTSVFFMFDTRYYYRLGLYDVDGNVVSGEARVNEIYPLLGLRLTFVLNSGKQEDYFPGLPLR